MYIFFCYFILKIIFFLRKFIFFNKNYYNQFTFYRKKKKIGKYIIKKYYLNKYNFK
jgi:hypothetical protein